jgi:hypothetical protein
MSSTLLSRTQRVRRRTVSGLLASALAAATLAATPSAVQAAEPVDGATFTWQVSQAMSDHLGTHTFTGGASEDASKVVSFPDGEGWVNPTTGEASVRYQGSVRMAFVNGGNPLYHVEIAEPQITVDASGHGTITAAVGSSQTLGGTTTTKEPARVTVTTFDATPGSWTSADGLATLAAVPDWAGVIAPDSAEATAAGIPAGYPLSGKAFAPQFFEQITPGVKSWFYVNGSDEGSATNLKKTPAAFTAAVALPAVSAEVLESTPDSLRVKVDGTGFSPSPANRVGVYVSLGDVYSDTNAAAYVATNWVNAAGIAADGTFSTTLALTPEQVAKLDAAKTYQVFTQKAHGQSVGDPSQSVSAPVTLDFTTLRRQATTLTADPVSTTFGTAGTLSVDVAADRGVDEGTVTVTGLGSALTAPVEDGTASVPLPAGLAAGTHTATVSFGPSLFFAASSTTATVTVAKAAAARPVLRVTQRPTTVAAGRATVTVPRATGRVSVTLTRGATRRVVAGTLANGAATVALPALAAGTWTAKVDYAGAANLTSSTASARLAVAKASVARPAVKVVKRPTSRKAGSLRVTVRSATAGRPTGTVRVQLVKGSSRRTYTVRLSSTGQATVRTSRLAKGTWRVSVAYRGDSRFAPRAQARVVNLTVTR